MPATRSESRILSQNNLKPAQHASAELRDTARGVERRQHELDAALIERDRAIVEAAAAGLTRRRIASVVGLSAARVQQICNAAANGVAGSKADGGAGTQV